MFQFNQIKGQKGYHIQARKKQRGQSLIEYLILVALMAIASIGIVKVLGQNLQGQFARVAHALRGENKKPRLQNVNKSYYKQKDLSNFFNNATTNSKDKD